MFKKKIAHELQDKNFENIVFVMAHEKDRRFSLEAHAELMLNHLITR